MDGNGDGKGYDYDCDLLSPMYNRSTLIRRKLNRRLRRGRRPTLC